MLTLLSGLPRRDFSTGVCESNSNWKQREETNVQGLELSIWGFSSVVRSEAFQHTVGAIGLVEASSENVSISTAVSGLVVKVFINAGDRVNAGQPLFSLDDRDLRAETVTRQATLEAARDRLGKLEQSPRPEEIPPAEARVREAEAALADASVQVKLIESVTDRRAIREEDLQRRRLAAKAAEAKLDETKAALALLKAGPWAPDLKIAKAEVTTAEAQLKRLQTDIERLTMRAPVTGEILQVNVRAGEYAQVGLFSLVRVFDCRSLTGGIRSNIRAQDARLDQAILSYEDTLRLSLEEVENSLTSYEREREQRVQRDKAVASNRRSVELARELYRAGLSDFLSVLEAEKALYTSENELAQSEAAVATNLVALYKALGGGW